MATVADHGWVSEEGRHEPISCQSPSAVLPTHDQEEVAVVLILYHPAVQASLT